MLLSSHACLDALLHRVAMLLTDRKVGAFSHATANTALLVY